MIWWKKAVLELKPKKEEIFDKGELKCEQCDYKSIILKYLTKHLQLVHIQKLECVLNCAFCEYQTDTEKDLERHLFCTHPQQNISITGSKKSNNIIMEAQTEWMPFC